MKFGQSLLLAKFGRERVKWDNTFPSTKFNGTTLRAKPPLVFFLIKEKKMRLYLNRDKPLKSRLFSCKHPFVDKPTVRTEPAEPSARLLQWRTKILGTVMENHPSTSLTYQIFRCSIICTSLTTWTPRLALPSPLQTMSGWTNTFKTRQSVQGCTNYNIAWGRGGKGEN